MFTAAQLKAYLGTGVLSAAEEAVLVDCEVAAVALVQKATGRFLGASESVTYYIEAGEGLSLFVPDELSAVSAVSYRGTVLDAWTDFVSTEYELHGNEIMRIDGLEWPAGRATVKVTGTRGYAAGAEPEPIRQLVKDLVNWQFRAGRKLALDEGTLSSVPGWDRVMNLYRAPLYG